MKRIFHATFQLTTHDNKESLTCWTFKEENMTTKFPTWKMIREWTNSMKSESGYVHFMSYVELSEDEECFYLF